MGIRFADCRAMSKAKQVLLIVLATLSGVVTLGAIGAVIFIQGGFYDVSATGQHWLPTHRVLEHALRQAVQRRADDIAVPTALADPARRALGAACFRDRCVACHGAPGVAPEPFALGLQPVPSSLVEASRHWRSQDLYWITRHGIKMSGMPAWEYRLDEQELWAVVSFLEVLPKLTPTHYRTMAALTSAQCGVAAESPAPLVPALGRVDLARRAFTQHGCTTCHAIPGVVGPQTSVGPLLARLSGRERIGGQAPATVDGLTAWIRDPHALDRHSAMPTVPVSETQARLMAEYLLRD